MTQYNSLNVKLSNSQLNKVKSSIKTETGQTWSVIQMIILIFLMNYC